MRYSTRLALWLATTFLCSLVQSADRLAADRLQQAAQPGSRAIQALLLDITQAGEQLITVGEHGIILRSQDSGVSWQPAQVPVSVLLTAVDFSTAEQGWAVGHDGAVLRSDDAGASWQKVLDGRQINALRRQQLEILLDNPPAGLDDDQLEMLEYAVDDALAAEEDGPTNPLLDVKFLDAETGFILGGYGLLLKTRDGGRSWRSLGHQADNPDNLHLNSLQQGPDGTLLIAGEAGLLLISRDQGEHWQALDSPYDGSFFAQAWQQQYWLLGLRGHLFSSSDGQQWQQQRLPVSNTLTAAISGQTPQGDQQLWLLGQGGVLLAGAAAAGQGRTFQLLKTDTRRAFSAGVQQGDQLVLAGEGGITRIRLADTDANRSDQRASAAQHTGGVSQ